MNPLKDIKGLNVMILVSGFVAMVMSTVFSWLIINQGSKSDEKIQEILYRVREK